MAAVLATLATLRLARLLRLSRAVRANVSAHGERENGDEEGEGGDEHARHDERGGKAESANAFEGGVHTGYV